MNELVFLEPNSLEEIPFTTSDVVANCSGVGHKKIKVAIIKNKSAIESFGLLTLCETESTGGRPEVIYKLNEPQSTFLITLLKNTLPVIQFKKELVKQFYIMQKELTSRKITREIGKQAREALTNSIQALPESPHKAMKYKHFTDLGYVLALGKNSKQLKELYGCTKKDKVRDRFTSEELSKVEKIEQQISVLIDLGYDYKSIKETISNNQLKLLSA